MSALKKLDLFLSNLDEKSRHITICLLRERHAGIRELANMISASSDMEVLMIIREIINPEAQKIMGKPIATFQRSKIDSLTGDKIVFSWWIDEELASNLHTDDLVDVIDENNLLRVVLALPSKVADIDVKLAESLLIISGKQYHKEIPLPCLVEETVEKTINNSVLEIKLNKRRIDNADRN